MRGVLFAIVVSAGCANASSGAPGTDARQRGDAAGDGAGSATSAECPTDQLATGVDGARQVTCTAVDTLSRTAIGEHCSAYLGWRDSCDGCTLPPTKWGRASTTSCSPGIGTNNTCTMPSLGGVPVHLFGLDLDGDMDGNDKLHAGLHCSADTTTGGAIAPCPAGQLVTGFNGTAWTCSSFATSAIAYVHASCSIYVGWQDGCGGCTTPPVKWGRTSDASCENGTGIDNTCNAPTALGSETVRLFGINTDGDVDDNDKLHVALRCDPAAAASTTTTTSCPAGQFVAATLADGSFRCDSAAPQIARYVADHCSLYFGWHDGCQGCITPPTKWGKVKVGACENGAGLDNTCSSFTLGQPVSMFGLSPDGNVDENDVLYIGLRCD